MYPPWRGSWMWGTRHHIFSKRSARRVGSFGTKVRWLRHFCILGSSNQGQEREVRVTTTSTSGLQEGSDRQTGVLMNKEFGDNQPIIPVAYASRHNKLWIYHRFTTSETYFRAFTRTEKLKLWCNFRCQSHQKHARLSPTSRLVVIKMPQAIVVAASSLNLTNFMLLRLLNCIVTRMREMDTYLWKSI